MALVRCPDCGRDVSTEAPTCPGCGRPMKSDAAPIPAPEPVAAPVETPVTPPKKMGALKKGCLFAGGGVLALFFVIAIMSEMARGCGSPPPPTPTPTKAQAAEAERDFRIKEAAAAKANKEADAQAARDAAAEKKGLASLKGINDTFARTGHPMIDSTQMFTLGGKRGVILNLVPSTWDRLGEYQRREFLHLSAWPLVAKEMHVEVVEFRCVGKPLGRIENNTFFEP